MTVQPSQALETRAAEAPAYFQMETYGSSPQRPFVVKMADDEDISHARRILNGEERERTHIIGRIVPRQADYNHAWSFHFDPTTVDFFEVAIEVCDATLPYVEDHLDEVGGPFLPGRVYCPWSSRLVRELPSAQTA